jgi:hypothetical protein
MAKAIPLYFDRLGLTAAKRRFLNFADQVTMTAAPVTPGEISPGPGVNIPSRRRPIREMPFSIPHQSVVGSSEISCDSNLA